MWIEGSVCFTEPWYKEVTNLFMLARTTVGTGRRALEWDVEDKGLRVYIELP
jgi:hypothetical protein